MKVHELKCLPEYYESILQGEKRFECRKFDRPFKVGDVLHLAEWSPGIEYGSGRSVDVRVTYILHGPAFGVQGGYCVMSISAPSWFPPE